MRFWVISSKLVCKEITFFAGGLLLLDVLDEAVEVEVGLLDVLARGHDAVAHGLAHDHDGVERVHARGAHHLVALEVVGDELGLLQVALDVDLVVAGDVAHELHALVEGARPEERDVVHGELLAQHVERGHLALVDGLVVVLDARLLARVPVRVAGHVARGEHVLLRGAQERVGLDAVVLRDGNSTLESSVRSPTKPVTGFTPMLSTIRSVGITFLLVSTMLRTWSSSGWPSLPRIVVLLS